MDREISRILFIDLLYQIGIVLPLVFVLWAFITPMAFLATPSTLVSADFTVNSALLNSSSPGPTILLRGLVLWAAVFSTTFATSHASSSPLILIATPRFPLVANNVRRWLRSLDRG